jgi:hypothetical protein
MKQAIEKLISHLIDFSEYIKNKVQLETKSSDYNCPQIIESELEWRLFLYKSIQYLLSNGLKLETSSWTDWCKKLNAVIINLFKQEFVLPEIYEALKNSDFKIKSPSGKATIAYLLSSQKSCIGYQIQKINYPWC